MTTQVARLLLRRIVHKVALSCLQTPFTPLLIYGRPSCHPHWSSTLLCVFAGFTCNSVHAPLSVACNPNFSSNHNTAPWICACLGAIWLTTSAGSASRHSASVHSYMYPVSSLPC